MTEQTNLVPKRRFKEFSNTFAWEQREYGEVIDLLSGQDFSPSEYNDTCNGIPYMTGASCIVGNETIVNRWTTVPRCLAEKGDVLLVCKGSGYGAIAVLAQDKAHIARQFMALKNLPNLDKVFNFYLLNSVIENIKKDARGLIAGIARDAVIKQEISIPLLDEQAQIGTFFKQLDHLITLHQRKLEKKKALKAAYLSEMFPVEGESEPKRRFAGFTQAWEKRKLGEISNSFEYGLNASATYFDGINKYIRITDIDGDSRLFNQSALTSPEVNLLNADNYLLKKGDILFARTGASVGKTYRYQKSDGKVYYAGFLIRARINQDFDSEFIFQNTLTEKYSNFIKITSQRSGQPGVNAQEYASFELMVPTLEEQLKIGAFFKALDDTINLQQRKLEKLLNLKKAYLSEIFV